MKKYYINMARSTERRKTMEEMYPGSTRIDAYDGNILKSYNDIVIPTETRQSLYELGCTFSHIKAIITAYKNGDDMALILEDDIYDTYKSKWIKSINDIVTNSPLDAECIILHCINEREIKCMLGMEHDYARWNASRWSTGAYYINKKGMKKIYDLFFKNGKIELDNNIKHVADYLIYNCLVTYNYTKPLFIHQIKESTIHNSELVPYHTPAYEAIVIYFESLTN